MAAAQYVLGVDVGTTTVLYCTVLQCTVLYCTVLYCNVLQCTVQVRGLVYTQAGTVAGQASKAISPVIPHTGWYEIDPDQLWDQVLSYFLYIVISFLPNYCAPINE